MECTIYCSSVVRAEARRLHRPSVRITFPFSFSLSKAEMIFSKNRDSSWVCRNQSFGIPQLMFGSCHIWSHRHAPSPCAVARRVFRDLGSNIAEMGKKRAILQRTKSKAKFVFTWMDQETCFNKVRLSLPAVVPVVADKSEGERTEFSWRGCCWYAIDLRPLMSCSLTCWSLLLRLVHCALELHKRLK